jgi:hypothetical protein
MQLNNTNNGVFGVDMRSDLVVDLKTSIGKKNLKKIYTYRDRKRKAMVGLRNAYLGDDRSEVHALGKLWLSLLDHTLCQVSDRALMYFSVNPHCHKHDLIGLCIEWHDFDRFLEFANKIPNYQDWVNEVVYERKTLIESDVYLRTRDRSTDLLLRPTSVAFFDSAEAMSLVNDL